MCQDLPDRPRIGDECDQPDVAAAGGARKWKLLPQSPQDGWFETFLVKEGKFTGKAELGVRTVDIIATRDVQGPAAVTNGKGPPRPVRENYLPAKYSMNSPLRANVTEAGPNVFDFDLTMGK